MKVDVQKSFEKDVLKITDKDLAIKILAVISKMEGASSLSEIRRLKKLKANGNFYRVQVGNHRIGLKFENNAILLLRCMDRKDIYKYFP